MSNGYQRFSVFPKQMADYFHLFHIRTLQFEQHRQVLLFLHLFRDYQIQVGGDLILLVKLLLRSEEHTSELQSRFDLVCRLLLEKKNKPSATIPSIRRSAGE